MNTGFDFKVAKLWEAIQGEKNTINNNVASAVIKMEKTPTCLMHQVCICLLNVQLHWEFSTVSVWFAKWQGELFTADWVMAQRCSNNYVNNFPFKLHKCIHTFAWIYVQTHADDTYVHFQCIRPAERFISSAALPTLSLLRSDKKKRGNREGQKEKTFPATLPYSALRQKFSWPPSFNIQHFVVPSPHAVHCVQ